MTIRNDFHKAIARGKKPGDEGVVSTVGVTSTVVGKPPVIQKDWSEVQIQAAYSSALVGRVQYCELRTELHPNQPDRCYVSAHIYKIDHIDYPSRHEALSKKGEVLMDLWIGAVEAYTNGKPIQPTPTLILRIESPSSIGRLMSGEVIAQGRGATQFHVAFNKAEFLKVMESQIAKVEKHKAKLLKKAGKKP